MVLWLSVVVLSSARERDNDSSGEGDGVTPLGVRVFRSLVLEISVEWERVMSSDSVDEVSVDALTVMVLDKVVVVDACWEEEFVRGTEVEVERVVLRPCEMD